VSTLKVEHALEHKDILGAGAKARRAAHLSESEEYETIERERKRGTLHSGSGAVVHDPSQARAIAASEARKSRRGNNPDNHFLRSDDK